MGMIKNPVNNEIYFYYTNNSKLTKVYRSSDRYWYNEGWFFYEDINKYYLFKYYI